MNTLPTDLDNEIGGEKVRCSDPGIGADLG
jgi:hypothetical protein